MIKKLLIANRGEIACRIDRTCRRLGIPTATIHSTADRNSVHVRTIGESIEIGPAPSAQSYLNIEAVIAAAKTLGVDAVHPGIGFLSEDPAFADAVQKAGLLFIGPTPELLHRFGDKWAAKHQARLAGVTVIGGSEGSSNDPRVISRLIRTELKLPVVLKAAAGGGGRGVRIIRELDGLDEHIESAMREAKASFGREDLIVEEFIASARHVEVQVAGDGAGDAIHLYERECSLQRRFQKVIEEAPAVGLAPAHRQRILDDAVRLAKFAKYANLGTVEFLVTGDKHYFLECNPRLQVEHTCTEEITGLDLVEMQLRIAAQGQLPISQEDVRTRGHAIQLRVYAEDARTGFTPSTGTLARVEFPAGVRVETGVESGSVISPYYDPMIAKLIVHAPDRAVALERCVRALDETIISGVETNVAFLQSLLRHPEVKAGTADNRFIDRELEALAVISIPDAAQVGLAAALCWASGTHDAALGLWSTSSELAFWSYDDGDAPASAPALMLQSADDRVWPIVFGRADARGLHLRVDGQPVVVALVPNGSGRYLASIDGRTVSVTVDFQRDSVTVHGPSWRHHLRVAPFLKLDIASLLLDGRITAPMMGTILKVNVNVGDVVNAGDVLVIEESMKMEMPLYAALDGTVSAVLCRVGEVVERNQTLVELKSSDEGEKA